ncbi:MAG: cobalamin biosynthesis protein, partial [Bacteroidales bacterium]
VSDIPMITYVPKVLYLGVGCRKNCNPIGIFDYIIETLKRNEINPLAIASVSTIDIKKDEPLVKELGIKFNSVNVFSADDLKDISVPNPSEKAFEVTGIYGVAESAAIKSAYGGRLLVEKQKGSISGGENNFTFAVAINSAVERRGYIEIVGAGPGDPELVSVRGKRMLEEADLILYAGSLVPKELTYYAKPGAVVRSSASMDLQEQFTLMKEFYDKGLFIVRLHTGDPCIYGAIQEQMAFFDKYNMSYHITPGISSFLAAAAELQSQFTIPEKVQTIILTRGGGRTLMPKKEKLSLLARSQSTMCIFLSA